jgi:hypothetical protein
MNSIPCPYTSQRVVHVVLHPRQGMHEEFKTIDREEGYAIKQERLERIGPDLGIAAWIQNILNVSQTGANGGGGDRHSW